jgi:hypothetical protein
MAGDIRVAVMILYSISKLLTRKLAVSEQISDEYVRRVEV